MRAPGAASRIKASVGLVNTARTLRRDSTDPERILWGALRSRRLNGIKFRRQFPFHQFVLDFYCDESRLGVELDGGQHAEPENEARDAERTAFLASYGVKVLRFWNRDVRENLAGVLETILRECLAGQQSQGEDGFERR